jgi:Uma2 family endonuclease
MPDDGRRYEIIDGMLLVTPAPRWQHQRAGVRLGSVLDAACPDEFVTLNPIDVRGGPRTSVQPDLSVVREADLLSDQVLSVPVLAVEILGSVEDHASNSSELRRAAVLPGSGGVRARHR